jgi:hypothetical protein
VSEISHQLFFHSNLINEAKKFHRPKQAKNKNGSCETPSKPIFIASL